MGAHIGIDCQIIIDGTGYWLAPRTYKMQRSHHAKLVSSAGGTVQDVEAPPNKRIWSFTIQARNSLTRDDGEATGITGQEYRDALMSSYDKETDVIFIDPSGTRWTVHFDNVTETIADTRSALVGPAYLIAVELVEA